MRISFQQGIISYPSTGPVQSFLAKTGVYVSFQATNGPTDIAFAHGSTHYLHTESVSVSNAWGPIPVSTDTWIYWDIDLQTAVRTFGQTYSQPLYGASEPTSPVEDQHWFNTTANKMYVYQSGGWREVVRVFAAMVNNAVFTALGSGFPLKPFAGTQVGLTTPVNAGRIIVDNTSAPIRRLNREFFTTESDFFANGSPVNTIRLEANVLTGTAIANLGAFQVVKLTDFGEINLAAYNDLQTTMIAMVMEGLLTGETGTIVVQGTVTNPAWNFTTPGAELWVNDSGELTETDLHETAVLTHPVGKPAIGRVITPTTIFFDQGLGGKGDQGAPGVATVDLASTTVFGVTKLSVAPVSAANPIAVGDNDPRNSDARVPLSHTQAATTIVFTPYSSLTSAHVQGALQELEDDKALKVNVAGDTMTGFLTLSAAPTATLHAATKGYVDTRVLDNLADVVAPTPALNDILQFDGTNWINQPFAGGGAEPDNQIVYGAGGGTTVDSDPDFTYNPTTGQLWINTPDGGSFIDGGGAPGEIRIHTPLASATATNGGQFNVITGDGGPDNSYGGSISLQTGDGGSASTIDAAGTSGGGGTIFLSAGNGGGTFVSDDDGAPNNANALQGGHITLASGFGGGADVFGVVGNGNATAAAGGDITISAGNGGAASVFNNGNARGGRGGDITLETRSGGSASVGGTGTATYGQPGNIVNVTDGGFWIQTSGNFGFEHESEAKMFILRGTTDGPPAETIELFINGTDTPPRRMILPQDDPSSGLVTESMTWLFNVKVVGREEFGVGNVAGYQLEGVIDFDGTTTAIIGSVQKTVLVEDDVTWDANVFADNSNSALAVSVTGPASGFVRWTAFARIVAVGRLDIPA